MDRHKESCFCSEMQQLLEEQGKLSFKDFRFVCESIGYDTIPFILSNQKCRFEAFGINGKGKCFVTPVFRLEKLDTKHCCATLSLLEPVDMDGCPIDLCEEVYSLLKTDNCLIIDLSCFCAIQPLSPKLVDRPLPIIEPKC
ncbi:CotY/CotZ family spore coat protein [Neobacillus mesonae]|uniref:CotY/CotZ family spore coat protein n=1 Tax=Neobacillus mesonae TaxID=1193713 RepID=UPI002041BADD|nr:CotY/CotZ family spore coat protein [Neobacillus mesonae]MCM3568693.1 CotY/CotZ family spore coat protein [Neobacillus mesonae]